MAPYVKVRDRPISFAISWSVNARRAARYTPSQKSRTERYTWGPGAARPTRLWSDVLRKVLRTGITKRLSTFCRQYYPLVATRLSQASKNLQGRHLYAWVADLNRMSPSINPCTRLIRRRTFLSALVSNVSDQTMRSLPRALTAAVIGRCSSGVHHSRYIRAQPKSNRSWRILATPV
jgi:hypothetical protein